MSLHHFEYLNRDAYISSIATIQDPKSLKFANMSLQWWDEHLGWEHDECLVLCDADNTHLCYIFFKIDPFYYMTVHNIFTPLAMRRNGYAHELLSEIFDIAIEKKVRRFKLTSISNSLDFYLDLGFVYWGVNSVGDYYCDLPLPKKGLDDLKNMISTTDIIKLIGRRMSKIYNKVNGNHLHLNASQSDIYEKDKIKMGDHYMLDSFMDVKKAT